MSDSRLRIQKKTASIPATSPQRPQQASLFPPQSETPNDSELTQTKRVGHRLEDFRLTTPIQPKLTIGQPGDQYEQEADQVAAQVVQRIHAPVNQLKRLAAVQRQTEEEEELQAKPESNQVQRLIMAKLKTDQTAGTTPENFEANLNRARSGGQPLMSNLQTQMGSAMGADFSQVKVHTDSQADHLNESIQAKAFTTGQDIFFRQGEYEPSSRQGQELIAHELTHVVQQGGGLVQAKPTSPTLSRTADPANIQRVLADPKDLGGKSLKERFVSTSMSNLRTAVRDYNKLCIQDPQNFNALMDSLNGVSELINHWFEQKDRRAQYASNRLGRNDKNKAQKLLALETQITQEKTSIALQQAPRPKASQPQNSPPPLPDLSEFDVPQALPSEAPLSEAPPSEVPLSEAPQPAIAPEKPVVSGWEKAELADDPELLAEHAKIVKWRLETGSPCGELNGDKVTFRDGGAPRAREFLAKKLTPLTAMIEGEPGEYSPKEGYQFQNKDQKYWAAKENFTAITGASYVGKTNQPLFDDENPLPKPEHVVQGGLGDCYLMAALSSLAQSNSEHIKNMIRDNGDGTVTVRLYDTSKSRAPKFEATSVFVKVNKSIPEKEGKNIYAGGSLWAALIEKAYVSAGFAGSRSKKDKGSYKNVADGGLAEHAFEVITGQSANKFALQSPIETPEENGEKAITAYTSNVADPSAPDAVLNVIAEALAAGQAVAAGTRQLTKEEKQKLAGETSSGRSANEAIYGDIVYGHAYSILAVDQAKKTISLRNPWGQVTDKDDGKRKGVLDLEISTFLDAFAQLIISDQVWKLLS
jgi:Domain of unknown function (DUF4157)/Calpain family cysteine protease